MGAWGPKLYQDDVADDVRNEYKDLLKHGKTNEEATNALISKYASSLEDDEDTPVFWFALADIQWNLGRLLPLVKEKALEYLKQGNDLKRWEIESPKEAKIRKQSLKN